VSRSRHGWGTRARESPRRRANAEFDRAAEPPRSFIELDLAWLATAAPGVPVIVNGSGHSVADYAVVERREPGFCTRSTSVARSGCGGCIRNDMRSRVCEHSRALCDAPSADRQAESQRHRYRRIARSVEGPVLTPYPSSTRSSACLSMWRRFGPDWRVWWRTVGRSQTDRTEDGVAGRLGCLVPIVGMGDGDRRGCRGVHARGASAVAVELPTSSIDGDDAPSKVSSGSASLASLPRRE
jgi:hypothetical protein